LRTACIGLAPVARLLSRRTRLYSPPARSPCWCRLAWPGCFHCVAVGRDDAYLRSDTYLFCDGSRWPYSRPPSSYTSAMEDTLRRDPMHRNSRGVRFRLVTGRPSSGYRKFWNALRVLPCIACSSATEIHRTQSQPSLPHSSCVVRGLGLVSRVLRPVSLFVARGQAGSTLVVSYRPYDLRPVRRAPISTCARRSIGTFRRIELLPVRIVFHPERKSDNCTSSEGGLVFCEHKPVIEPRTVLPNCLRFKGELLPP